MNISLSLTNQLAITVFSPFAVWNAALIGQSGALVLACTVATESLKQTRIKNLFSTSLCHCMLVQASQWELCSIDFLLFFQVGLPYQVEKNCKFLCSS